MIRSSDGDCAPSPSHTTGRAVFRGAVPPEPETFPDVPPNPSLQPEDRIARFGQLEIIPPAPHIPAPGVAQLVTGSTLVAAPHLPPLGFESLDTLRRYSDRPG